MSTAKTALVLGASGAIGRVLVQQLLASANYRQVIVVIRRTLGVEYWTASLAGQDKLHCNVLTDFSKLEHHVQQLGLDPADAAHTDAFMVLGTTIKQAKTKARFMQVDYDYAVGFANGCKAIGVQSMLIVTAEGASNKSPVFYNRVKGEVEVAFSELNFARLAIFRPSLLLGRPDDGRFAEKISAALSVFANKLLPNTFAYRPVEVERVAKAMLITANDPAVASKVVSNKHILQLTLS